MLNELSLAAQGTKKIFWSESQQFDWGMFKEKRAGYEFIKAMTHSGISYEVDVKEGLIVLNVEAYFIYGKSWVMKGYKKPHLLAHEKIHFDISEIFKRRLDKLCDRYRVDYDTFIKRDYQEALQRDFDIIFDEMDKYQREYDEDTSHGTISFKQKKWEKDIREALKNTNR
tara:strand:+ start:905 stop:1414 length:510 start_codon:yes stop_codon:yes gene_type:complete